MTPPFVPAAALAVGFVLAAATGCGRVPAGSRPPTSRIPPSGEPAAARASSVARAPHVDPGWRTYRRYCSGCHGDRGDGLGPAALFLDPRPRDFTTAIFKFTSTPAGSLPTDADLLRVIERGLPGTAMPGFPLLSTAEKTALLTVIKKFSSDWEEIPPGDVVQVPANPFAASRGDPAGREAAIELGETVYHGKAQCWTCHPIYATPDRLEAISAQFGGLQIDRERPRQSLVKVDQWEQPLKPPDFTRDRLKSVADLTDLYRVIAAGIGGTAMASWEGTLGAEELWAVTLYVDSLREQRLREPAALLAPEIAP